MPPPPGVPQSEQKKKRKGKAPRHKNSFAFIHNAKSKKTDKILASPNVGACKRCHEKIEWRKKYRKYKPRTQLGKCHQCKKQNIKAAYHTLCPTCSTSKEAVKNMEEKKTKAATSAALLEGGAVRGDEDGDDNDELGPTNTGDDDDAEGSTGGDGSAPPTSESTTTPMRKTFRVCAICGMEPVHLSTDLSSYGDGEELGRLEEKLRSGDNGKGGKMNLREMKGVERKIEKIRAGAKEEQKRARRAARGHVDEQPADDEDGDDAEEEEEEEESAEEEENVEDAVSNDVGGPEAEKEETKDDEDEEDPFLRAVGGKDKLLVGDAYRDMLLAKQQQ